MKAKLKIYGLIVLALGAALAVIGYGNTELSALVWHARHGFHTEIAGTRLSVPLFYEVEDPHGLPSLSITKMPGYFLRGGALIMIDFHSRLTPEALEEAEALARQSGIKVEFVKSRLGEHPATFAGRQGKCVEYRTEITALRLQDFEIVCSFEGEVSVHFIGSPNLKGGFYNIIRSAEPVNRKT